jgi:hypothetical protein
MRKPFTQVLFSRPFPIFANKLNAWATTVTCEWLMGPCKVNDVEVDDGQVCMHLRMHVYVSVHGYVQPYNPAQ